MWPARGRAETRWQRPTHSVSCTFHAEPYQVLRDTLLIQLHPNKLQQRKLNMSLRCKTLQHPIKTSYFIGFCLRKHMIIQYICIYLVLLIAYIKVYCFTSPALSQSLRIDLCVSQLPHVHDSSKGFPKYMLSGEPF